MKKANTSWNEMRSTSVQDLVRECLLTMGFEVEVKVNDEKGMYYRIKSYELTEDVEVSFNCEEWELNVAKAEVDQVKQDRLVDVHNKEVRKSAVAKLTEEERKVLGL